MKILHPNTYKNRNCQLANFADNACPNLVGGALSNPVGVRRNRMSASARRFSKRGVAAALLCLLICSCSVGSRLGTDEGLIRDALSVETAEGFQPLALNEIAVLPLVAAHPEVVTAETLETLTKELLMVFDLNTSLVLLNIREKQSVTQALSVNRELKLPLFARARELGKSLSAQGVLCGVVNRYTESRGSKFGGESRSAVEFRLWLIDRELGKVMWSATYSDTDQPLSENVLRLPGKLKDGVGYQSAAKLTTRGLLRAAEQLESVRKEGLSG